MHNDENRETHLVDGVEPQHPPVDSARPNNESGGQRDQRFPEPPAQWSANASHELPNNHIDESTDQPPQNVGFIGTTMIKMGADEAREFERGRKFVTAAQITALISLFIGGIVLSAVSVVLAVIGFRSLSHIATQKSSDPLAQSALKRSGIIAIIMSILALVINIVSLIAFYPMITEMLQQGNLSGILPGGGQAAPNGSGTSSGSSLFG